MGRQFRLPFAHQDQRAFHCLPAVGFEDCDPLVPAIPLNSKNEVGIYLGLLPVIPPFLSRLCRTRPQRLIGPRIDDRQANSREIGDVPRDDAGAVNARNCGNHQIDGPDRAAGCSTSYKQISIGQSGVAIESQNAPPEVIREHGAGGFLKRVTTTAGW
jgi:hypothetical protein